MPTFNGTPGNDNIVGSDVDDTIVASAGNDTIDGGNGTDTYDASLISVDMTVNLSFNGAPFPPGTGSASSSATGLDGLTSIENVTTGSGNDLVIGDSIDNLLMSGAGNDAVVGGGGNDTIDGGSGADDMQGGIGDDVYFVDDAGDSITENLGEGTDRVVASVSHTLAAEVENLDLVGAIDGTGNALGNIITGSDLANAIFGLGGNDTIGGGGGNDTISGGAGDDLIDAGGSDDSISWSNAGTGDGADDIDGGSGNDELTVDLDNGAATVPATLTAAPNGVDATQLDLTIGTTTVAVTGVERIVVDGDDDGSVVSFSGDLAGTGVADSTVVFNGTDAADSFNGAGVTSTTTLELHGAGGADILTGGAGDDLIAGDAGDDTLSGGDGDDVFDYAAGDGADDIDGGADTDTLNVNLDNGGGAPASTLLVEESTGDLELTIDAALTPVSATSVEALNVTADPDGSTITLTGDLASAGLAAVGITGSGSADEVDASALADGTALDVAAGGGADVLRGGAAADTLSGEAGDDAIHWANGGGADLVDGGDDTDTLTVDLDDAVAASGATLEGSVNVDDQLELTVDPGGTPVTVTVENVEQIVIEGDQDGGSNVTLSGDLAAAGVSDSTVVFNGSDDADDFDGSGVVSTTLELNGAGGNDTLRGGGGDDVIDGGAGDDALRGNAGADVVSGGTGDDSISWSRAGGGDGADTIDGGETLETGGDTLTVDLDNGAGAPVGLDGAVSGSQLDLTVDPSGTPVTLSVENVENLSVLADANGSEVTLDGNLLATGVEAVFFTGSAAADSFDASTVSSATPMTLVGGGGDDVLSGGAGGDLIEGGAGADDLSGGGGGDAFLYARGEGADSIDGGTGFDTFTASLDDGNLTPTTLDGSLAGSDLELDFGALADVVSLTGVEGVTLNADTHGSTVTLTGELADSGLQAVTVVGSTAADTVDASGLTSPTVSVTASGDAGADSLTGGAGADTLGGGADADEISGGGGADEINAGSGDDTISWANGDGGDAIDGEEDADLLNFDLDDGTASPVTLEGTVNVDQLELTVDPTGTPVTVTVQNVEQIDISGDAEGSDVTFSGDLAAAGVSDTTVTFTGTAADDSFDGSGVTSTTTLDLDGAGGADSLTGGAGADVLTGGAGQDVLTGNGGADTIDGGSEDDAIAWSTGDGDDASAETIDGGENGEVDGDTLTLSLDDGGGTGTDLGVSAAAAVATLTVGLETVEVTNVENLDVVADTQGSTVTLADDLAATGIEAISFAGSAAADVVDASSMTSATPLSLVGGGAADTFTGGSGADVMSGDAGADVIDGGAGDDSISGGADDDVLSGGDGDDSFEQAYGDGADTIDGGTAGETLGDTLDLDLADGTATATTLQVEDTLLDELELTLGPLPLGGSVTATDVENLNVTADADGSAVTLAGDLASTGLETLSFSGGAGDDSLDASGASTAPVITADGGDGSDTLVGGASADTLRGGDGADELSGGGGNDVILGEGDDDLIRWANGDGSDAIHGGTEVVEDLLTVDLDDGQTSGPVVVSGSVNPSNELQLQLAGQTVRVFEVERIEISGDLDGSDVTLSGDLSLAGVADGTVVFTGTGAADLFDGSGVTSTTTLELNGLGGDDTLSGGAGDDALDGGADVDTASYASTTGGVNVDLSTNSASGQGNDTLFAIENVIGGSGNDTLTGDGAANALFGGDGNDQLAGGAGDDSLSGGDGDDGFDYVAGGGLDTVDGGVGDTDTVNVAGTAATETFAITADGADIDVTIDAADALVLTNVEEIVVDTNGGGDTVTISGDFSGTELAPSTITVNGDAGNNVLDASGVSSVHNVVLNGAGGNDTLSDGAGADTVDGGDGDDVVNGALDDQDDDYRGGNDEDTIRYSTATAAVAVNLAAGTASGTEIGNDLLAEFENLEGGAGADTLTGDAGDNVFIASGGDDTVSGGGGSDTYDASPFGGGVFVNLESGDAFGLGHDDLFGIANAIGGSGNDDLVGNAAANELVGNGGADDLTGGGGDDRLEGGGGDDDLVGGAGTDTAVFTGNQADYDIDFEAGTVTDTVAARDGTDTVTSVEFLEFADGTIPFEVSPLAVDDFAAPGPSGNLLIDVIANDTGDGGAPLTHGDVTDLSVSAFPSNGLALVTNTQILYVANDGYEGPDFASYSVETASGVDTADIDVIVQAASNLPESSFVNGGGAPEVLTGQAVNNVLFAGGGADVLYALQGDDTLDGGDGNDILVADGGRNQLAGGLGDDLFVLTHEPADLNEFEVIRDLDVDAGEMLLLGLEGLTNPDGTVDMIRLRVLSSGDDSFLLADMNDDLGTDGHEAILARLDDVDSAGNEAATLTAIIANDPFTG